MALGRGVLEKLQRKERKYEVEQLMKRKRSEEYEALEEVFDRPTLMTVYSLLNQGTIGRIHGVIKAGKESRVYSGVDPEEKPLAIKIYLTLSSEFKSGMLPYIVDDPRFKRVKRDTRSLIYAWAQKEFKNLQKAREAGVPVPRPIHVKNNVLVMEFIGDNETPAPLLKDMPPKNPKSAYRQLLKYIRTLYRSAGLVHGDLSEYNVLNWGKKLVVFDVSQAVLVEHPMADQLLRRDLGTINNFFRKLGVETKSVDELHRWVVGDG